MRMLLVLCLVVKGLKCLWCDRTLCSVMYGYITVTYGHIYKCCMQRYLFLSPLLRSKNKVCKASLLFYIVRLVYVLPLTG